jgi:hypothetical protein
MINAELHAVSYLIRRRHGQVFVSSTEETEMEMDKGRGGRGEGRVRFEGERKK